MGFQNFFSTSLSSDISAGDTTIPLNTPPSVTSGRLVLNARNVNQREIIEFTGVSGSSVTGVTRGVGGTTARAHASATVVQMNFTAQDAQDAIEVADTVVSRFTSLIGDFVGSGCVWSQDSGLVGDMTSGVVYIGGTRVEVPAINDKTFTASKDTYVDLDTDGAPTYSEVPNNDPEPAQAADTYRLGYMVTDGSAIDEFIYTNTQPQYLSGWSLMNDVPDTIVNNGNRNYTLTYNSKDLTRDISEGAGLKLRRTVQAPDQSTELNGTNQYWAKTSPTALGVTDDIAAGAWLYLTTYQDATIISQYNGTSGWVLDLTSDGRIAFRGYNASVSNQSNVVSYRSVPLNQWVHVAAQLDMSAFTATTTTSYIMIDGVDVTAQVARSGTNPTSFVSAGNLEVGGSNGGTKLFPGKLAQVFVASAKITQANMRLLMGQGLTSSLISTHNIKSAFSFDGVATDLNTSTANDLAAQNSAGYDSDSPFALGERAYELPAGAIEYAVVSAKPTFSTNTTVSVQVPRGCALPTSGGVTSSWVSRDSSPYGMPPIALDSYSTLSMFNQSANTTSVQDLHAHKIAVTADGNTEYDIEAFAPRVTNTSGTDAEYDFYITDGSNNILGQMTLRVPNGTSNGPGWLKTRHTPPSGSFTFKFRQKSSNASATQTIAGTNSYRSMLRVKRVED